jgi:hypothetical protein
VFADNEDVGGPERKMDRLGVLKRVGWVGAAALEPSVPDEVKYDAEGGEFGPWDVKAEDTLCRPCDGLASSEPRFSIGRTRVAGLSVSLEKSGPVPAPVLNGARATQCVN